MKKNIVRIVAIVCVLFSVVFGLNLDASAIDIITTSEIVRVARTPNVYHPNYQDTEYKCTAMGGIYVTQVKNSMFVVKSSQNERMAALYYYPDLEDTSRYKVVFLRYAGHANALTMDAGNVYIAGWCSDSDNIQQNNTYNNWILQIPRSLISSTADRGTLPKDSPSTEEVEGYKVLHPKMVNPDESARGTTLYVDYTESIASIARYGDKFIVPWKGVALYNNSGDKYYGFTTAQLVNSGGKTLFVVSTDPADRFIVQNNTVHDDSVTLVNQDIGYSAGKGLVIPVWYSTGSGAGTKNVIMWADIDSEGSTIVNRRVDSNGKVHGDGKTYRYYVPDKISAVAHNIKGPGTNIKMYQKMEFESAAFSASGELLVSANAVHSEEYIQYLGSSASADGVFKITHSGGQNFNF